MSQSSQKPLFPPETGPQRRVQVLVPFPLTRAFDYSIPEGMDVNAGDYVRVPFGKKEALGVVWNTNAADTGLAPSKIKSVLKKYDSQPLPPEHRQFIERVARYTMSDLGSVLKMTLNVPEALDPPRSLPGYTVPDVMPQKLSAHRKKIMEYLADGTPRRAADIARTVGCSASIIRSMAEAGQIKSVTIATDLPCVHPDISPTQLSFSDEQKKATEQMITLVEKKNYSALLLDGVTGSGKTEVYFEAVAEALKQNRQVLILLPEIALSAQFLDRFTRRFKVLPAIWHSDVPPAQRRQTWQGVAAGQTKVVVGARSALFLPFANLGLIIVDEEHDASYKQEEGVMYHARDMSVLRANLCKCPVILVSATPSLETTINAQQGKYASVHLPARYTGIALPDVKIVDLKKTPPIRGRFISPPLEEALRKTLAMGEQSLLFLNRRGYAPLTLCRSCGHRFQCPSCSAWLVEHRRLARLQCHHCGHAQPLPHACPSCKEEGNFASCGPGVERIQEEVQAVLPDARTLILTSDVVTSLATIQATVKAVENKTVDVIIGTQIIAKGHHFPDLTLVGIIDADIGLSGGDLRAGERTFQLLHQVSGRAGRGDKTGHVLLQTYLPDQLVIRALAANNRDAFTAAETTERQKAGMPPFGRLAAIIVTGADETRLDVFCRDLMLRAPRYNDIHVLGPAPAPLAFLRGRHRRRFLIKTEKNIALQKYLEEWIAQIRTPSTIQLKIDVDPQSFF